MPRSGPQTNFSGAVDAVLVLRSSVSKVSAWVENGTIPAYVIQLDGGKVAVVPAGPGHAGGAYRDAASMLASRPVPMAMRPSIAMFVSGERSVTVVQPRRWRSLPRWFVIQAGVGYVRVHLPAAHPSDLLSAGGENVDGAALSKIMSAPAGDALDITHEVIRALDLPVSHLLELERGDARTGSGHVSDNADLNAMLVEPHRRAVRRFERHVRDNAEEQDELREWTQE